MIQTLFILATLSLNTPAQTSQVSPCVWPKCEKQPVVAQVSPCVWPKCEKQPIVSFIKVAFIENKDITTCDWPKKCEKASVTL